MDMICRLAEHHNIAIVEDNAHGLFGQYKGQNLGTFGALATQSFHETKNIQCGEGGALVINNPRYAERAEIIREKGTNRSRFFRGQVDKYTWVDIGSSYLMSDMMAGFLVAQLENHDKIQSVRQTIWQKYHESLSDWAAKNAIQQPTIPAHCQQSYHLYYLLLPSLEHRQVFIDYLRSKDIWSAFHYLPLHLSQMGQGYGYKSGDCPVTEAVSDRLVRLPLYSDMTDDEQDRVIQAVLDFSTDNIS
jgi:dTDP-4-amino-4,6-dideoxygalactose transaminase